MSEAMKIFKLIHQAFALSEPDCSTVFKIINLGNETCYAIHFNSLNAGSRLVWMNDDIFLNGDSATCSIWRTMKNIIKFFESDKGGWRQFLTKHHKILDICRIVSESSSADELKIKFAVAGISL